MKVILGSFFHAHVVAIQIYISSLEPSVEGEGVEVICCIQQSRCGSAVGDSCRAASRWSSERTSTPIHKGARKRARLTRKLAATVAPRKKRQEATVDAASHTAFRDDLYIIKQINNHTTTLTPRIIFKVIGSILSLLQM